MRALGNPVRVEILQQLRVPCLLGEIRVAPRRNDGTGSARRAMSRAAVQEHLEKLLEVGAVRAIPGVRDGRSVTLYAVDQRQLFAFTEELRDLARWSDDDAVADGTQAAPMPQLHPKGPNLVLMNGPLEGRAYPLDGSGPWRIGRGPGNAIRLVYDPYLSLSNTEIRRTKHGFEVVDLERARNGTALNWTPLARGQASLLRTGDVVGAGRSLLLLRGV